jgi:hypothetical protein
VDEDGRLALRHDLHQLPVGGEPLREVREAVGEVEQQLQALGLLQRLEVLDDRVEAARERGLGGSAHA